MIPAGSEMRRWSLVADDVDDCIGAVHPDAGPEGAAVMGIVSYAQNFEDVMLWRALGDRPAGFWIDVGAADPDFFRSRAHSPSMAGAG